MKTGRGGEGEDGKETGRRGVGDGERKKEEWKVLERSCGEGEKEVRRRGEEEVKTTGRKRGEGEEGERKKERGSWK